ncbi:MAG: transglycosylase domain-containing protein [Patescibacteria group bacterium]
MVRKIGKKPDDTLAPKLIKNAFTLLGEALSFVGKPLYLLLSFLIISVLLVTNITGYVLRTSITLIIKTARAWSVIYAKYARISFNYLKKVVYFIGWPRQVYPKPVIFPLFEPYLSILQKRLRKLGKKYASHYKKSFSKQLGRLLSSSSYFLFRLFLAILTTIFRVVLLLITSGQSSLEYVTLKLSAITLGRWLRIFSLKLRLKTIPKVVTPALKISKLRIFLLIFLTTFIIGLTSAYVFWEIILRDLPPTEELVTRRQEVSTKIYDRNGELLYNIYKDQNRTPVPIDRIPAQVRLATIAIEDAEFYNHPGISARGIARAIIKLAREGEITGGSTITQQLVKNALLTPEKTLVRKLKEIVLAIRVELAYSKDEILEMYLNEVAYGGTAYGIQEAARVYFNKDVDQLTLGEASLLAGLPKSPTLFSPFGQNPNAAISRQREVLRLMRVNGFITSEQKSTAENEEIKFSTNITNIKAPHFVMYVRQALVEKYGEELVSQGGLTVTTTLDLGIQKLAEEVVKKEVENLDRLNVGNGAALVLDTKTGEILAMVGSYDYFDQKADGNVNLTTSSRQPGSSIKVVNYSYALSSGFTPATILEDTQKTFYVDGQPPYTPRNYDNVFRGKLTLRNALAESRNVPAVKVLDSYGVSNMIEQGRKMGITTWTDPSNYGLSLTLGGGEVKLIDLATVYATISNYGKRPPTTSIKKITDYKGKILEEGGCEVKKQAPLVANAQASESASKSEATIKVCKKSEQVLDPRVAYILIDILRDNKARSPAFGTNSLLVIPGHADVAVKTGTSNDLRDNLTIGFNQKYLVAVWVGNNDNSPMSRVASGITGATPIWHQIMSSLLTRERNHEWQIPEGLVQLPICSLTNSLACEGCFTRMEWFLEENKPTQACNPEYIKYLKEQKENENPDKEEGEILLETASIEP